MLCEWISSRNVNLNIRVFKLVTMFEDSIHRWIHPAEIHIRKMANNVVFQEVIKRLLKRIKKVFRLVLVALKLPNSKSETDNVTVDFLLLLPTSSVGFQEKSFKTKSHSVLVKSHIEEEIGMSDLFERKS